MAFTFNDFKENISSNLPDDICELNWIIKHVGYSLFGGTWSDLEPTLIGSSSIKESKIGSYFITEILRKDNDYNRQQAKELLNHLFSESLKKKNKTT